MPLPFKILHRIYNCNYHLFLWNIEDSSQFDVSSGTDNFEHFFYYCPVTFWKQFIYWLSTSLQVNKNLSVLEILFDVVNVNKCEYYWPNFAILVVKYFISKCK